MLNHLPYTVHSRKLHNTIQELKGNIRVFCRIRPLLGKEVETGKACMEQPEEDPVKHNQLMGSSNSTSVCRPPKCVPASISLSSSSGCVSVSILTFSEHAATDCYDDKGECYTRGQGQAQVAPLCL